MIATKEYISACFSYDEESGNLIWKRRPRSHFATKTGYSVFNAKYPGTIAGHARKGQPGKGQYVIIHWDGRSLMAHRIIWEMHYGPVTDGMKVDHKDCDGTNNRLCNFRLASGAQNAQNARLRSDNTSGLKGVSKNRYGWRAMIQVNKKWIVLGTYSCRGLAGVAYAKAAIQHHGEFARLR